MDELRTFFEAGLALLAGFVAVLGAGLAFEAGAFEAAVAVAFVLGLEAAFFGFDSPVTA